MSKKKKTELLRLNLGSGKQKIEGFLSVDCDKSCKPDIVLDLSGKGKPYPWPWENDSVDEVFCGYLFHLLKPDERIYFMNELWRVLKINTARDQAKPRAKIVVPHWASGGAYQNQFAQFPPIAESSFDYFNLDCRKRNDMESPFVKANFGRIIAWSNPHQDYVGRADEVMMNYATHNINAVTNIEAFLFKLPKDLVEP